MTETLLPNGGFETAGTEPGSAADWSSASVSSVYDYAGYQADPAYELAFEMFEGGWFTPPFMWEFESSHLENALYLPLNNDYEDMEHGWDNDFYSDELISVEFAYYDVGTPQEWEDFEEEWNNDIYYLDWSEVSEEYATYDSGAEPYEDFEEMWAGNENYLWDWSSVSSEYAMYDEIIPEPYEDFEEEFPLLVMSTY